MFLQLQQFCDILYTYFLNNQTSFKIESVPELDSFRFDELSN